jgi:phage-related protein
VGSQRKPVIWVRGEVKTPPFSEEARFEAGLLLRQLQNGELLSMPQSRPMPTIGAGCHELRIKDRGADWRIFYHLATDAVVVLGVEKKTTPRMTDATRARCRARLKRYLEAQAESG